MKWFNWFRRRKVDRWDILVHCDDDDYIMRGFAGTMDEADVAAHSKMAELVMESGKALQGTYIITRAEEET